MQPTTQINCELGLILSRRRMEISAERKKIAAAAGISASYYGAIERGSLTPPNSTLVKIIRALRLKSDEVDRLFKLAALNRGLQPEDAGLPDEISGLIVDIRRAAFIMPTRFVQELRARIREVRN